MGCLDASLFFSFLDFTYRSALEGVYTKGTSYLT